MNVVELLLILAVNGGIWCFGWWTGRRAGLAEHHYRAAVWFGMMADLAKTTGIPTGSAGPMTVLKLWDRAEAVPRLVLRGLARSYTPGGRIVRP